MFCAFYLIYVACLTALSAPVAAQSCNTTGTYQACCPLSNGKALLFDNKQYRVRCDYQYHVREAAVSTLSLEECARKCHEKGTCVGVRWQTPQNIGRRGRCDCLLDENLAVNPQGKHVSLALIESSDNATDINDCNNKLKTCEEGRRNDTTTCNTKVNQCKKENAVAIEKCNEDCNKRTPICKNDCKNDNKNDNKNGNKNDNKNDNKKSGQSKSSKKKNSKKKTTRAEFKCIGGKNWIDTRHYIYKCTYYAQRNLEKKGQVVPNDRACGQRCNRRKGCKWAYFDSKTGICKLGRGKFKMGYLKKWGARDRVVMHVKE